MDNHNHYSPHDLPVCLDCEALTEKIEKLKEQIEKMKNCGNCHKRYAGACYKKSLNCDKWEVEGEE
jgi:ribosomal protein L37AE/L43A